MSNVIDRDTATIKMSNADLGIINVAGFTAKEIIGAVTTIITKQLGKKLGTAFIPGLNIAATAAVIASGIAAVANHVSGNDGFEVTIELELRERTVTRQGKEYKVEVWNIGDIDVDTY